MDKIEPLEILEGDLINKIHTIHGVKVMLDSDLAKIYGYETKYLNRQVKNNRKKFEGEDFMFQLTEVEAEKILMCNFCTSRLDNTNLKSQNVTSSWGGTRKLPYAFTEQGIYMLMTVLKGELATRQSRALVMAFKMMKDYILEKSSLTLKVLENSQDIGVMKTEIKTLKEVVDKTVLRPEISPILLNISKTAKGKEFLLFDGKPIQAKEAFMEIYANAKRKIYIVDNYINIKTLHLLQTTKPGLEIIFFTDNVRNYLRKFDLEDFEKERPDLKIKFVKTNGKIHDRFIILDEKIFYQAGGSSKDAGNKITSICEISDNFIKQSLANEIEEIKENPELELK